jgi:hypothetical protein
MKPGRLGVYAPINPAIVDESTNDPHSLRNSMFDQIVLESSWSE